MHGKIVLVTGASGGLGTYITQAFLDAGATVIGTSRKIQQSDFTGADAIDHRVRAPVARIQQDVEDEWL